MSNSTPANQVPQSSFGGDVTDGAQSEPNKLDRLVAFVRTVTRVRLAGFGLAVLLALAATALLADVISPYDPIHQSYREILKPPSRAHLLGTDSLGRDVLSRLIHGSRVSLEVGLISVGLAVFMGSVIGLASGYLGGVVDEILMRIMDSIRAFPAIMLALAITAALGMGIENAMIAIGIVSTPQIARLVRGQALQVRELEYVLAARSMGAAPMRMMWRHIFPNVTGPVIVQASLMVSHAIITEASLSFLGVGVRPPAPTWGSMLNEGYGYLEAAPWLWIAPGITIFIAVLGLNLLGDGLRGALDPRLSRRGIA